MRFEKNTSHVWGRGQERADCPSHEKSDTFRSHRGASSRPPPYEGPSGEKTELRALRLEQGLCESEATFRTSEISYRDLFNHSPIPSWVFDRTTRRFVMVNDAATAQYGYTREEFMRLAVADLASPEDADRLARLMKDPPLAMKCCGIWTHKKKDGTFIEAEVKAQLLEPSHRSYVIVYARDVAENRFLERQLRQAQKMEPLGLCVGAVVHDFNNLLGIISSYSALALSAMRTEDPVRDDIAVIDEAAGRAAELTSQLLAFSRRQSSSPAFVDVRKAVEKTSKMVRRLLGANFEVAVVQSASAGQTMVEPCAIEQIVMNLVVNARDAMPKGGKVTIETQDIDIGEEASFDGDAATPGPYVMLAVSDNGIGMDTETQAHIFEALYTTKPPGKGTGLGLCTVAGIVKKAGGFIRVTSAPGEGATFRLYFPRA